MTVGGIENAMVGFALFDAWSAAMHKLNHNHTNIASPLVDAAFKAFESYADSMDAQHSALIAGVGAQLSMSVSTQVAGYALNAQRNGANLITTSQMAPFLALNIMA